MEFLETSFFTKCIVELLQDHEYADLQIYLTEHPDAGVVIPRVRITKASLEGKRER